MANNVIIDIDASTKDFESALDGLTAKVKSNADSMDKAFSSSTNSVKKTSNAVNELKNVLSGVSMVAAGKIVADEFEKAIGKVKDFGKEIYGITARMQSLEMGMKSIVTSDLLKTGQVRDYTEATEKAVVKTQELLDWFKELSLKSPYELVEVMESFKQNANMGQSVETAKKTTEAILALGAGLGMGQAEMKRFSAALAQTGATGRITAMDLRQFANNGFGMDKMNQIFSILSEKYKIVIKDNNDFNKAVAEGKITTDDFFEALNIYALDNYGNAIDAMASTIDGLKSSLKDIKVNVINDLFLETSKTVSKTLAPYVEYLMKMLTGGDFSKWGQGINQWAQGILEPFQKIGELLENGRMAEAIAQLKDFFSGNGLNLGAVKSVMESLMGDNYNDEWFDKLWKIKEVYNDFLAHKDTIIAAIKGIGTAIAIAFAVNKIQQFGTMILSILTNPVSFLIAAGAAIGIAWSQNLFHIQDIVANVKNYIVDLFNTIKEDGLSGGLTKLYEDAKQLFGNLKQELINLIPEEVKGTLKTIWEWIERIGQAIGGLAIGAGVFVLIDNLLTIAAVIGDVVDILAVIPALISSISWPVVAIVGLITAGFAILGQFIDFGQLFVNLFNTVKSTAYNVVNGIIENVGPKFEKLKESILGLIEALQPIITVVVVIAGTIATVLATAIASVGTIIVGILNGILQGFDDLVAAVVDYIDFVVNVVRLPFDIISGLFKIIVGVIKGDNDMIEEAVNGLVERLKAIWTSFKAFWIDIWGFVKDFFKGIWKVIVETVNSIDITEGLKRLFGDEVAQKFEEIRDKVLGIIEEIKNAWSHAIGLMNGDIVVVGNKEVGKEVYSEFEKNYEEELEKIKAVHGSTDRKEYVDNHIEYFTDEFGNRIVDRSKAEADYDKYINISEEALFDDFAKTFVESVQKYYSSTAEMKGADGNFLTASERKSAVNAYIEENFGWAKGDSYMESLLEPLMSMIDNNIIAQNKFTKAVEKSAEAGKSTSSGQAVEEMSKAQAEFSSKQLELLEQAMKSLEQEMNDALSSDKSYNQTAIEELGKVISKYENDTVASSESIFNSAKTWIDELGLSDSTNSFITKALESVKDSEGTENILSMLQTIVSVLETGNTELLTGIKDSPKNVDYEKETESLWNKIIANNDKVSVVDKYDIPKTKQIDDNFGQQQEKLDELERTITNESNKLEEQNKKLDETVKQLENLETEIGVIDIPEDDPETQKKMDELKSSLLDITKSYGATQEQINELESQLTKVATAEDIAKMAKGFREALQSDGGTYTPQEWSKYLTNTQSGMYKVISKLPESINEALTMAKKYYAPSDAELYSSIKQSVGYINLLMKEIEDPKNPRKINEDQIQAALLGHFNNSGLANILPEDKVADIMSILTANTETLSIDTLMAVASVIVNATKEAGFDVETAINSKKFDDVYSESEEKSFKSGWDEKYKNAWESMYADFLSGHEYEIKIAERDMSENDFVKWVKEKGYDEQSYYDSQTEYHNLMETLEPALTSAMDKIGLKSDTLRHVTVDNFAEAKDYIGAWDEFATLYQEVNEGVLGDQSVIAKSLEEILTNLMDDDTAQTLTDILKASDDPTWTKIFMAMLKGELEGMSNELSDAITSIGNQVGKGGAGTGQTTGGTVKAEANTRMEDYYKWKKEWQEAEEGSLDKSIAGAHVQGYLNGILHDYNDEDIYNYNMSNDDARKYSIYDPEGVDWDKAERELRENLDRGIWSENIYEYDWKNSAEQFADQFMETIKAKNKIEKEHEEGYTLDENGNQITEEDKGLFGDGILGMLFGDSFTEEDFQSLFSLGFEGIADALDEETIASLKNLFGMDIDGEKAEAMEQYGTAFSLLAPALESLSALFEADGIADMFTSLFGFINTPIDATSIEGWTAFGQALNSVAFSLINIMAALSGGTIGEMGEDGTIQSLGELGEGAGAGLSDMLMEFINTAAENYMGIQPLATMLFNLSQYAQSIVNDFSKLVSILSQDFPTAIEKLKKEGNIAISTTNALVEAARQAAAQYHEWADAINEVIEALRKLASLTGGSGGTEGASFRARKGQGDFEFAGGTTNWRYGTAVVGEHGPELITNNGSRAWTVFSNNTLMDEIAHTRHTLNLLSNSAELFAYNRLLGGTGSASTSTDNSQNISNNFGTIIGDDAFEAMVEDKLSNVMRRQLRLAR